MSSPTRTTLIAGNWKMNGSLGDARTWAEAAAAAAKDSPNDVAVFPPAPWLMAVGGKLTDAGGGVHLGGQAVCWESKGAFTGAVAASMLAEAGCAMVLCGHSERRHVFGETDEEVAGGLAQALEAGLEPVLCVGETLEEREAGQTEAVILRQLDAGLARLRGADDPLTIAYEPVWAIGTGKAATPTEAAEAHAALRARVAETDAERAARVRILYGGSANPDNMGGFLDVSDVDGLLIGGASLDPAKFAAMIGFAPAG